MLGLYWHYVRQRILLFSLVLPLQHCYKLHHHAGTGPRFTVYSTLQTFPLDAMLLIIIWNVSSQ